MDIISTNEALLYVILGMFCTWFVQITQRKYRQASRFEKVRNAFVCSILTAAISIPILEYFTSLPPSICLIIGAVIGTLGFDGWERLLDLVLDIAHRRAGGGYYGTTMHRPPPPPMRPNIDMDAEEEEPPPPRKKNASK